MIKTCNYFLPLVLTNAYLRDRLYRNIFDKPIIFIITPINQLFRAFINTYLNLLI